MRFDFIIVSAKLAKSDTVSTRRLQYLYFRLRSTYSRGGPFSLPEKMGSNGYFTDNIVAVHAMRRCL